MRYLLIIALLATSARAQRRHNVLWNDLVLIKHRYLYDFHHVEVGADAATGWHVGAHVGYHPAERLGILVRGWYGGGGELEGRFKLAAGKISFMDAPPSRIDLLVLGGGGKDHADPTAFAGGALRIHVSPLSYEIGVRYLWRFGDDPDVAARGSVPPPPAASGSSGVELLASVTWVIPNRW